MTRPSPITTRPIRLDPKDARAYIARGDAWEEKESSTRPSPTSTRRSGSIPGTPGPTTPGATPGHGRGITTRPSPTSPRRSDSIPRTPRAYSRPGPCLERRTNTTRPSPTSTRRSGSIPRTPRPTSTGAAPGSKKEEYDKAIADFNEAIRLDPKDADAYGNRGDAWDAKDDSTRPSPTIDEAIRLDPKDARRYVNRGMAWYEKDEYDKAIADFDEAIRLDPKHAQAYNNRGEAWYEKEDSTRPSPTTTRRSGSIPSTPTAYRNRGVCSGGNGEYRQGDRRFRRGDPARPQGCAWRTYQPGQRLAIEGRSRQGHRRFRSRRSDSIPSTPRRTSAGAMPGKTKGDHDKAIADFNEAIRLDPENAEAYVDRGMAWQAKGDFDKAIADFDAAIRLDPEDARRYVDRGMAWAAKGHFEQAIADFNEAVRLDPELVRRSRSRACLASRSAITTRPSPITTRRSGSTRTTPQAYVHRGIAWRLKGNHDKAIADFSAAIRLQPGTLRTIPTGASPGVEGRIRQGHRRFRRGHPPRSEARPVYITGAIAWEMKQDFDKAIADYMRSDPTRSEAQPWRT